MITWDRTNPVFSLLCGIMRYYRILPVLMVLLVSSCAHNSRTILEEDPALKETEAPETVVLVYPGETGTAVTKDPGFSVPEKPVIPPIPEYILGKGLTVDNSLSGFLLVNIPGQAIFP